MVPIRFDTVTFDTNSINFTFLDSFHQNLSNDVYFVWFRGGPHFPIVPTEIIMSPFIVTWFSNFDNL